MVKTYILSTLMLAISIVALYGIFAFANWAVNPDEWSDVSRILCSLLFGVVFLFWVVFVISRGKDWFL